YEVYLDWRHLGHPNDLVVVPVALDRAALVERDLRLERTGERPSDAAFDGVRSDPRIENGAGAHGADDARDFHGTLLRNREFHDVRRQCAERLAEGDPARASRQGLLPIRMVGNRIQDLQRTLIAGEQVASVEVRVPSMETLEIVSLACGPFPRGR